MQCPDPDLVPDPARVLLLLLLAMQCPDPDPVPDPNRVTLLLLQ